LFVLMLMYLFYYNPRFTHKPLPNVVGLHPPMHVVGWVFGRKGLEFMAAHPVKFLFGITVVYKVIPAR